MDVSLQDGKQNIELVGTIEGFFAGKNRGKAAHFSRFFLRRYDRCVQEFFL
ncbi:MAG: hypothetical protein AAGF04_03040 [Chlamydiota bacterium]